MPDATILTERFDRALLYATHVHGGQTRKGTSTPYVAHLLAVAATVLEYGGTEDQAIAALLHDAVEDQGGQARLSDIRNRFGDRVADIVCACSDSVLDSAAGERKQDWCTRKTRYIDHLKAMDQDTLLVSLSDKVHNSRSILRDLRKPEIGPAVFARFSNPRKTRSGTTASSLSLSVSSCPASSLASWARSSMSWSTSEPRCRTTSPSSM
jgi:(p)ppGpp synthase/HD superfamily hydrolase